MYTCQHCKGFEREDLREVVFHEQFCEVATGLSERHERERAEGIAEAIDCCDSCGVPFAEHLGVQGTCEKLSKAEAILGALYDEFCPEDSHGVTGSEFRTCKRCHTGGSLTRQWKHADDCEMKKVEDYLFELN